MLPTSYYRTLHTRDAMKLDSSLVADDVVMDEATLESLRNKTEKKIQEIISPLLPRVAAGTDPVSLVTVRDAPELSNLP